MDMLFLLDADAFSCKHSLIIAKCGLMSTLASSRVTFVYIYVHALIKGRA